MRGLEVDFIRTQVEGAGAAGVVVGLSGGVDSAVVAALAVRALGAPRVFGLLLPVSFTPAEDNDDARRLAEQLGIAHATVPIQTVTESLFTALRCDPDAAGERTAAANIRSRIRMVALYYVANTKNYLVAGTGDKSEELIGFFTKHGDGGVDFQPIAHLYKTQVRALARELGIPEAIAGKPASPQLYPGHLATDEIPLEYEQMDPVLMKLVDEGKSAEEAAQACGVPIETVREIERRIAATAHKRRTPPDLVT